MSAITGLENWLAGKTFTAIAVVYRLLKFAGALRIL